jgi:hypothetical protein
MSELRDGTLGLMRRGGFNEQEARAYYQLLEGQQLFLQIEEADKGEMGLDYAATIHLAHFLALRNELTRRVWR